MTQQALARSGRALIYDACMAATEKDTTMRVRPAVAEDARRLVRQLAAAADRDVTQSEAIGAALAYALDHVADVAATLAEAPPDPGGSPALSNRAVYATAGK